jgi:hypothetical protein
MTPLVARAVQLGVHLQKSVQNNRVPAAQQTLALYSVVKGLGRIVDNETMREKIPQLKAELAPKHKTPRVKKTKEQVALERAAKSQADRLQKAQVIVNNGGARPGTTPVVLSSPAAPSSPVTPATPPAPAAEPAPVAVPAVNGAAVATPASH